MRFIPDTIASRTIAVLLFGLAILHASSIWLYRAGLDSEIDLTNEIRLAERLVTIKTAIARLPASEREKTAHSLSGGPLEVHWSNVPLTFESQHRSADTAGLRRQLTLAAASLGPGDLLIGSPSNANGAKEDPHLVLVSMRLSDGSWANFTVTKLSGSPSSFLNIVLSTSLSALGALAFSALILRSITLPLRRCAASARNFILDSEPASIEVTGPSETRDVAAAINELQRRVKRLVDDRTLMLAAISHDLKSPITRIRLRAEQIGDSQLRSHINADLGEMLEMVDAALAFLKSEQSGEPVRDVDLNAIIESIRDEMTDLGHEVSFEPDAKFIVRGRHLGLKRAFHNVISNAVKYGDRARVAATKADAGIVITIDDDGPGIPVDQREAVFAPFYRLESSRNRATGGSGLGLTIARAILRSHGGDVCLQGSPAGGLRVVAHMPMRACGEVRNKKKSS
jgi:signal transduction histidine kinase